MDFQLKKNKNLFIWKAEFRKQSGKEIFNLLVHSLKAAETGLAWTELDQSQELLAARGPSSSSAFPGTLAEGWTGSGAVGTHMGCGIADCSLTFCVTTPAPDLNFDGTFQV